MNEQFIDSPIKPEIDTINAARLSAGAPAMPGRFRWGARTIEVADILRTWRSTGPCRHGSGEQYVRRHWFEVLTDSGQVMKIYFDRQPRAGRKAPRWWLFTMRPAETPDA